MAMLSDPRRHPRARSTVLKRPAPAAAFAKPATLLIALLIAIGAAGCGDDKAASGESLPARPKLTVPNGSVSADKKKGGGVTDTTGGTGNGTGTGQTSAGTGNGGTPVPRDTGGQGTGTGTGQATPQDTGGAAPGN